MSAPNTNIKRQGRRHRPALIGIAAVLVFSGIVFLMNMGTTVGGDGPIEAIVEEDASAYRDSAEE